MFTSWIRSISFSEFFWCSSSCCLVYSKILTASAVISAASIWLRFYRTVFLWMRTCWKFNRLTYLNLLFKSGHLSKIFSSLFFVSLSRVIFSFLSIFVVFKLKFFLFVIEFSDLLFNISSDSFPLNFLMNVRFILFLDRFIFRLFGIT